MDKLVFSFVFSLWVIPCFASAATNDSTGDRRSSGPYCGLYCLYSILKIEGQAVDFHELVKPEYISSEKGSSFKELKQAAQDFGVNAASLRGLTLTDLKNIDRPIILHVKSDVRQKEYDHFVLYCGDQDGKARIFDPPSPIKTTTYHELAPRWNGTGLIVSREPINTAKILFPAQKRLALFIGLIAAAIVLIRITGTYISHRIKIVSKRALMTLSVAQSAGLVMVALFSGIIYHFISTEGFLSHAGATEPMVKASFVHFIPKVSAKDIENAQGSVVLVDARQENDYEAGHIDGAVNIPTTLCAKGRIARMGDISKDKRIVIYCQSAGCPYAGTVASHLMEDGFENIAIYKGGWIDWKKKKS